MQSGKTPLMCAAGHSLGCVKVAHRQCVAAAAAGPLGVGSGMNQWSIIHWIRDVVSAVLIGLRVDEVQFPRDRDLMYHSFYSLALLTDCTPTMHRV